MLFLDKKQISAEDLMSLYGLIEDYRKLEKSASFEPSKDIKLSLKNNGGAIKKTKTQSILSYFTATNPRTGLKSEIRYSSGMPENRQVGDKMIEVYEPKHLILSGNLFEQNGDIDKAVYIYLNPNTSNSPLRDNKRSKDNPKFEYIDNRKRSEDKMDKINLAREAMNHVDSLGYDQLHVFAKGIGISNVDKKEYGDIKADLAELAYTKPTFYMEKARTQLTYTEGRIKNLKDKNIVKLVQIGQIRRWEWAKGQFAGEIIVDITNPQQDAMKALTNFFYSDIQRWVNVLADITNDITAKEKAERDLELMELKQQKEALKNAKNLPEHLRGDDYKVIDELVILPSDNKTAVAFLTKIRRESEPNSNASFKQAKDFLVAIDEGKVDHYNYREWIKKEFYY